MQDSGPGQPCDAIRTPAVVRDPPFAILADNDVIINSLKGIALGIICSAYLLYRAYLEKLYQFTSLLMFEDYSSAKALSILTAQPSPGSTMDIHHPLNFMPILFTLGSCALLGLWDGVRIRKTRLLQKKTEKLRRYALEVELKLLKLHNKIMTTEKLASLGVMASGVAHEIRNPLAAVAGYMNILRNMIGHKAGAYLKLAQTELDHVKGIVRTLWDSAQIQQGRQQEAFQEIDVNHLLMDLITLWQHHFEMHQITIRHEFDRSLPIVMGNPDHLRQVFTNLFLNALQAMEPGGTLSIGTTFGYPDWSVQCAKDVYLPMQSRHAIPDNKRDVLTNRNAAASPQPFVQIDIRDTGHGIATDLLPKIFDPFFTTKAPGGCPGLGLSTSHAILEQHRGGIRVHSEVHHGTTFTISLPCRMNTEKQGPST